MTKPIILITGSNGRLGTVIRKQFGENYTVIGIDNDPPEKAPYDNYFQVDMSDKQRLAAKLQEIKNQFGSELASVIHLVAYYSFADQNWENYQKITIDGTKNFFSLLKDGFTVQQFVFSSTLLVYKPTELGEKVTEDSLVQASWAYPKSKVLTENILLDKNETIPVVILRIAGCYDDNCHSIPLSNQIKMSYEKDFQRFFFPGNTEHGAPFLHLEDLAEAFYQLVEKRNELPHEVILNLGESKTYSYKTILNRLEELNSNQKLSIYPIPKSLVKIVSWLENHIPFRPKPFIQPWMIDIADDHMELDISKAKTLIGWKPKHDLLETLPIMVQNLKNAPKKWYQEQKLRLPKNLE